MNFSALLTEHFTVVVFLACLIIGYIIKHASFLQKINNNDIPLILAIVGAILNVIVIGMTVDAVVYGAFMGLASTGLHQTFKNFIDKEAPNDIK